MLLNMSQEIDAIFEDGVLRPLEPVNLREHERVRLSIEQETGAEPAPTSAAGIRTLHDALAAAGLLGCIDDGPTDLSTNPKYMEGFGEHEPHSD
jgi:predicted DNA-binding antitoxin AbrB/MazE fold protein